MKTKILILLLAAFSLIGCSSDKIPNFDYSYNSFYDCISHKTRSYDDVELAQIIYKGGNTLWLKQGTECSLVNITDKGLVKLEGEDSNKEPVVTGRIKGGDLILNPTAITKIAYRFEGVDDEDHDQYYKLYVTKNRTYIYFKDISDRQPTYQYGGFTFNL